MTAPYEHHGEASRARDRRQPRIAEEAARGIARSGRAAGRTVERLSIHRYGLRNRQD